MKNVKNSNNNRRSVVVLLCTLSVAVLAVLALFVVEHYKLYVRMPFLHPNYFFVWPKKSTNTQKNTPSLLWMAPFFSGGGYSSEALSFASGLLAADTHDNEVRFKAAQHGDSISFDFVYGMNQTFLNDLILTNRIHDFSKK